MRKKLKNMIFNYEGQKGMAYKFREKRSALFKDFVEENFAGQAEITIVDFGGIEGFWKAVGLDYLREKNMKITLVNLSEYEIENKDIFVSIASDARYYTAETKFDICFSNSCIEHVGQMQDMISFRDAVQNVAKTYFIQTPSYHFPIEPHFVSVGWHWLPKTLRVFLIKRMSIGHFDQGKDVLDSYVIIESCYLLSRKIFKALFFDGRIENEKLLFLTKSFIAIRNLPT